GSIHTRSDREGLKNFSVIRIHHHQHLGAAARREEPPVLPVHGHGHRRSGRRNRPSSFDRERARVDRDHVVFFLVIVVNHSLAIGDRELYTAAQIDGLHYRLFYWI